MAEENLRAYPVLKLAGALGGGKGPGGPAKAQAGEWVALFPEGEMRYPGPLGPLREGANWLARKAGVPLLPVALRVVLRGYEHPEAFLWVGRPLPPGGDLGRALGGFSRRWTPSSPKPTPGRCRRASGRCFGGGGAWRKGCFPW